MPLRLLALAGLLGATLACDSAEPPKPEVKAETPKPTPKAREIPEGSVLFKDADAPFTTVHKKEGVATSKSCDDKACTWVFGIPGEDGKPLEDAQISVLFPKTKSSVDDVKNAYVRGPHGVFGNAAWKKTGVAGGNAAMPWLQEVTSFETEGEVVGRVLVGENDGGAFRIIEHMKREHLNAMRPLIQSIYVNFGPG